MSEPSEAIRIITAELRRILPRLDRQGAVTVRVHADPSATPGTLEVTWREAGRLITRTFLLARRG